MAVAPYKHKVQYYETDRMQITHHSNYIRFMEEARLDFLDQIGWGYNKLEQQGILSPVVNVSCDYKKTTSYPDLITIAVRVLSCTGVRLQLAYTMSVEDTDRGTVQVVCTGTSMHCFVNSKGRPISFEKQLPLFYQALLNSQSESSTK